MVEAALQKRIHDLPLGLRLHRHVGMGGGYVWGPLDKVFVTWAKIDSTCREGCTIKTKKGK